MKISQSFHYEHFEGTNIDEDFFFRFSDFQQVKWFFPKYNLQITESSLHWNLLFLHIKKNGTFGKNVTVKINTKQKKINLLVNIENTKDTEHIILCFFHYYVSLNRDKDLEIDKVQNSSNNGFLFKWKDIVIDLLRYNTIRNDSKPICIEKGKPAYIEYSLVDQTRLISPKTYNIIQNI